MGRQSKLRRARRLGDRKPVRPPPTLSEEERLSVPYDSPAEADTDADCLLAYDALRIHHNVDELPRDFVPRFFSGEDEEGIHFSEWVGIFRDLMAEKYGSLDAAEPRIRFILSVMMATVADHEDGAVTDQPDT